MSTIRERDGIQFGGPVGTYQASVDRHALLVAGDALADALAVQHPVTSIHGINGEIAMVWCDGCDTLEAECWAVAALAAWKAATG